MTRPFYDPDQKMRYGPEPVLTAEYPDFLPVTPLLVLPEGAESSAAHYRPWHSVQIDARPWIYEGMPPSVTNGKLHAKGPCAILTPRLVRGDFILTLEELSIAWRKDAPADEQVLEIVFGWDNAACTHAFAVEASGVIRLVSRMPDLSILAEAHAGNLTNIVVVRRGATFTLSVNGRAVLSRDFPDLPSGRVGVNLGLAIADLTTQFHFETIVAEGGDATVF